MTPDRRAEQILERLGIRKPPVDVLRVARELGARVERADLGEECSGVLVRGEGSAVIGVNYRHHPNRQRFTIAHELGHYVMHDGGTYVDRSTYVRFRNFLSGSGTDSEEREANQFGASLLMPKQWVREYFTNRPFDLDDDEALAAAAIFFGVSTQAFSLRLRNLGLVVDALSPDASLGTSRGRKRFA